MNETKTKSTEKYYGVRIGDPRRHVPYLMLGPDLQTPALFQTRAQVVIPPGIDKTTCVVVVKLNYGGKSRV